MADRVKLGVLDLVAHGGGAPFFAVAFFLYFFVSWAPIGFPRHELMCGSLMVAGVGAALINIRSSSRGLRLAGAVAMMMGLVAFLGFGLR